VYTGFKIEDIKNNPHQQEALRWIDVLVDGEYKEELKDSTLAFRGSTNQRIIELNHE
jgi:anaerobic ribonucleoside-triphosphate reductase activating protein